MAKVIETNKSERMVALQPEMTAVAAYDKPDGRSNKVQQKNSRLCLHMGKASSKPRLTIWTWDEAVFIFVWLGWLLGFNRSTLYDLVEKAPRLKARGYDTEGGGFAARIRSVFDVRFTHLERTQRTSHDGSNIGTTNSNLKDSMVQTFEDVLAVVNPDLFGPETATTTKTPELVEANKRNAELEMQLAKTNEHIAKMNQQAAAQQRMFETFAKQQGFESMEDMLTAPPAVQRTPEPTAQEVTAEDVEAITGDAQLDIEAFIEAMSS